MSMILDNFYQYLLKTTKTQNLFKKIYMPIQFSSLKSFLVNGNIFFIVEYGFSPLG